MLVVKIQPMAWKKMRRPDDLTQKGGEDDAIELDEGEKTKKKRKRDEDDEFAPPQKPVVLHGVN